MMRVALFLLVLMIGMAGCRQPQMSASSDSRPAAANALDCPKTTGPLTQQAAEREALHAAAKEVGRDRTCSIASVKEKPGVYEVIVRIDPPQSETKRLPEHWTVEIPKSGVTQGANAGAG